MHKASLPHFVRGMAPFRNGIPVPRALKYPAFRRYWLALLTSVIGFNMLTMFSLGWLMFELKEDTRFVGYVGLSIAAPAIILNLFGGVFADKLNAKRMLGSTQAVTAIVVLALAVLTLQDDMDYRYVLVAAAMIGAVQAFDEPTRQSIWPRLVDPQALPNAVALNSVIWTGTRLIGPPLAAGIIQWGSISTAIFISAAGFVALALVSQTLTVRPIDRARGKMFGEMAAGFLYVNRHPIFPFLIGMTCFNSMFGMSYIYLMPVMAKEVFGVGAQKIGLLMAASTVGSVTIAITAANLRSIHFRGTIIIGAAVMFGCFLLLFALTAKLEMYALSLPAVLLAGAFNSLFIMGVMTTLHTLVPDNFRGRVMGFYSLTWSMAPLGALQANFIAHYISPPAAVAIGGAMVIGFALTAGLGNNSIRSLGAVQAAPA